MRKFYGLVINEYIKMLCKISTKIMLAAIVVVALGYNAIAYMSTRPTINYGGWSTQEQLDYMRVQANRSEMRWEIERLEYVIENGIEPAWGTDDLWRWEASMMLFSMKQQLEWLETEEVENLEDIFSQQHYREAVQTYIGGIDGAIRSHDWMAYYRAQLNFTLSVFPDTDETTGQIKYLIDNEIHPNSWQNGVLSVMSSIRWEIEQLSANSGDPETEAQADALRAHLLILEYRLENNLRSYTSAENTRFRNIEWNLWGTLTRSTSTISLLSVLIIIVAGSILSAEFSAGTVKFLLINPVKRWKIFAAKYITVLTFSLAMLITLYVFNVIFAGVFLGFGDLFAPHLSVADGGVVTGSSLLFLASRYLLGVVEVIILGTFAFAVSSLVRSSALAIGLGVFLYFSGWMAVNILAQMNFYQAKYILFANTNLLNISHGMSGFVNHTLTFAVVNIAVYMFVFLLTAYDGFVRGDVK